MPANDRGPRGVVTPGAAHTDAHRDDTAPVRPPDLERLGVGAWLARIDAIEDYGHGLFWRSMERIARYADYATGENARPSLKTLAGSKAWPSAVRTHLRHAGAVGLLVATARSGRTTIYSLAWPAGATPEDVLARLREIRSTPPAGRRGRHTEASAAHNSVQVQGDPAAAQAGSPLAGREAHPTCPQAPHPACPQAGPHLPPGADLLRPSRNQSSCCSGSGEGEPDQSCPVGPDKGPLDEPPDLRPFPERDPEADLRAVLKRDPSEDELFALGSALRVAAEQRASDPRRRALVHALGEAMWRGRTPDGPGWAAAVVRRMSLEEQDERVQALERALRRPPPRPAALDGPRWIGVTPSRIDCRDRIETLERAIANAHELGEEPDPRTLSELASYKAALADYEGMAAR